MLSVVIPVFNEQNAIPQTISSIADTFKSADIKTFEIVIVNDGSTDETEAVVKKDKRATLVNLPVNHGYGFALKVGINAAKFDTIIITDADGTYPIADIPRLVDKFNQGFDLIIGQRQGVVYKGGILKTILRHILRFLVEFAAGKKIPDPNSGLRVFSKKTFSTILPDLCNRFSFTTSQSIISSIIELNVLFVPIDYNQRIGNSKVRLFSDSLTTLFYIVQSINRYNPLKIFMVLFGLIFSLGVSLIIFGLLVTKTTAIVLGVGTTVASIMVFSLGLLADALKASAFDSKK